MNYYKKLKDLREDNDATQQDIADYLGITQYHYATYEGGFNIIPITKLINLSKLYKTSIDYLIGKIWLKY